MIALGAQWGALALKAFVVTVALLGPETALTLISCFLFRTEDSTRRSYRSVAF